MSLHSSSEDTPKSVVKELTYDDAYAKGTQTAGQSHLLMRHLECAVFKHLHTHKEVVAHALAKYDGASDTAKVVEPRAGRASEELQIFADWVWCDELEAGLTVVDPESLVPDLLAAYCETWRIVPKPVQFGLIFRAMWVGRQER